MGNLPPPLDKITRPGTSGCLPRTRLFRLVDRSCRKASLMWICGPPGCGKTTLVSTYIEVRSTSCVNPCPCLPRDIWGESRSLPRFFGNLFARLSPGRALVFDDCQEIPAKSPIHDVIVAGLSRLSSLHDFIPWAGGGGSNWRSIAAAVAPPGAASTSPPSPRAAFAG